MLSQGGTQPQPHFLGNEMVPAEQALREDGELQPLHHDSLSEMRDQNAAGPGTPTRS